MNLITEERARKLGLKLKGCRVVLNGVGAQRVADSKGVVMVGMGARSAEAALFGTEMVVLPEVMGWMPQSGFDAADIIERFEGTLADDKFNVPAPIDGIFGAAMQAKIPWLPTWQYIGAVNGDWLARIGR